MPRQQSNAMMEMEGLIPKIRKRGCSSSSSSSSRLHSYRFRRTILVGKKARGGIGFGFGLGGSRSSTPVPTWKMTPLRSNVESPRYSQKSNGGGKSQPVSVRRLAATIWEMNEMPSPKLSGKLEEKKKNKNVLMLKKEKSQSSVPAHLSDPSHSPFSERMDRSATGSYQRRSSSISQRLYPAYHCTPAFDSLSSGSLMEVETRSRVQTPSGSVVGVRNRLKDVSNALTTSKELLKIINRVWSNVDQPSSSMSLVSALHAELERARLLVNQLIQEQRSDRNEINYLMKCFAEEKAAWKNKERQVVEAAIETIAGELEVEKKLRHRYESLNKKIGRELAETKASFLQAVKELESEKRAREIIEQVCDELARDMGQDKVVVETLKRDSAKVCEEVEKEREMLHLSDMLREERVQMKLSEAKHQFEEKNTTIDKRRKQLEAFLGRKKGKEKRSGSQNFANEENIVACLSTSNFSTRQNEAKEDDGEVEDVLDSEEDSAESELHSVELNMDNDVRSYRPAHASAVGHELKTISVDDEVKGRNFIAGRVPRRSTSLQRSISEGVDWGIQPRNILSKADGLEGERATELEKLAQRKSSADTQRNKSTKGVKDHILSSPRAGSAREFSSPTRQWEQPWPSRDACNITHERSSILQGSGLKSRFSQSKGEGQTTRRSKW